MGLLNTTTETGRSTGCEEEAAGKRQETCKGLLWNSLVSVTKLEICGVGLTRSK